MRIHEVNIFFTDTSDGDVGVAIDKTWCQEILRAIDNREFIRYIIFVWPYLYDLFLFDEDIDTFLNRFVMGRFPVINFFYIAQNIQKTSLGLS